MLKSCRIGVSVRGPVSWRHSLPDRVLEPINERFSDDVILRGICIRAEESTSALGVRFLARELSEAEQLGIGLP